MIACFFIEQFAVLCERTRLPHLEGTPFVLMSGQSVAVASPEAIHCGIRPGMALPAARALAGNDLLALPYDRSAYDAAAVAIWDVLATESDVVEPESPELCYLELTGAGDPLERATKLSALIAPRIGLRVQIGLARSKFAARHAATSATDSPVAIPHGEEWMFLAEIPLRSLKEVSPSVGDKLHKLGLRTLGDIARTPIHRVPRVLRPLATLLNALAQGNDSDRVRPLWPPRHIEVRHTVPEEEPGVDDREQIELFLRHLATQVSRDLRSTGQFCRDICLRVGDDNGIFREETERLAKPQNATEFLFRAALRLLEKVTVENPVRQLQLQTGGITTGSGVQLALFHADSGETLPQEKQISLDATIAFLRRKYGLRAILNGSLLARARRINLWTHPLGHLLDEPITVATDSVGQPVWYRRTARNRFGSDQRYQVRRIQDRWKERRWFAKSPKDQTSYRVETDPWGVSELHALGIEWRLTGVMD